MRIVVNGVKIEGDATFVLDIAADGSVRLTAEKPAVTPLTDTEVAAALRVVQDYLRPVPGRTPDGGPTPPSPPLPRPAPTRQPDPTPERAHTLETIPHLPPPPVLRWQAQVRDNHQSVLEMIWTALERSWLTYGMLCHRIGFDPADPDNAKINHHVMYVLSRLRAEHHVATRSIPSSTVARATKLEYSIRVS